VSDFWQFLLSQAGDSDEASPDYSLIPVIVRQGDVILPI
jgi:hypothetical protein